MNQEIRIRATKIQIQDFKESMLWKDIKHELGIWIKMAKEDALTIALQCASEEVPTDVSTRLAAIGGRIEAIYHLLQVPDNFLQELEEQTNDTGRNQTD
jgi:hypothetical protein